MKLFHCSQCQQALMFENSYCLSCNHALGFLPDTMRMVALEAGEQTGHFSPRGEPHRLYRMCQNYQQEQVCNWMVEADDPLAFCISCRLNRTIPDLSQEENRSRWHRLEIAKRRLLYSLLNLKLPVQSKQVCSSGLAFDFLLPTQDLTVTSGHADGLITINAVEADDPEREKVRVNMHEPYRTILGHFRHESAHYYWDLLIRDGDRLTECRAVFGDDSQDYGAALARHYQNGPPADWLEQGFISSYASCHAWEDWAETWAHYLHIIDTMETAQEFNLLSRPIGSNTFDKVLGEWPRLTFALNSINRSMGARDVYPFVVTPKIADKLEFIHRVVTHVGVMAAELPQAVAAS